MSKKYLYYFSEGNEAFGGDKVTMKNTLGGKGAGLAEMTAAGMPVPGCEAESPAGGKSARSAQNPPGGAESAPAGRVFLVLLWAVYRMRTRITAGMLLSFSLRRASTAPVASSMV